MEATVFNPTAVVPHDVLRGRRPTRAQRREKLRLRAARFDGAFRLLHSVHAAVDLVLRAVDDGEVALPDDLSGPLRVGKN